MENVQFGLVSVIIPTYNRAGLVVNAVESVLGQTYKNIEIIVVDDGSTDDTPAALEKYNGRIRYLRQENAGPGPARNLGVAASDGHWIAFLDSDDEWHPEKIEFQLGETLRLGASCSFHDSYHTTQTCGSFIPSWNRYVCTKKPGRQPLRTGTVSDLYGILCDSWHFFILSTMLIRRDVFITSGGFDPAIRTNQDVDLYLRVALDNTIAYIDRVLVRYSPGPERSYEIAARVRKGSVCRCKKLCIYQDRIAALVKALHDRIQAGDTERSRQVMLIMKQQLRTLVSLYLKNGMFVQAGMICLRYLVRPEKLAAIKRQPARTSAFSIHSA